MQKKIAGNLLLSTIISFSSMQAHAAGDANWADMSLSDLANVKVESASRKQQSVTDTAAAIFVITADDIKRSGVLSLPEALHMAPGVEVARLANNKWAVSIRGFNGRMANKLLVMVDGRSIYSSLYGGVLWETEDIPMAEIERIEVIRGAGGLAWGSNAVNGVVNIITRRTQDTSGWLADGHIGTSTGKAGGVLRYGAKMDDGSAFRVTLNDQKRDGGKEINGTAANDYWNDTSLAFRFDKPENASRRWFASGKVYDSVAGEPFLIPTFNGAAMYNPALYGATRLAPFAQTASGGNLLGRVETTTDGGGEVRIQAYVDQFKGAVPIVTDERTTADLDAQHHFILGHDHDIVWGGNYRQNHHKETVSSLGFLTAQQTDIRVNLASVFAQDEWAIVPKKFSVQAGMRVERQTYGGTAPLPAVKAMWHVDSENSIWASWAKTVRSPSVVDEAFGANPAAIPVTGPGTMPVLVHGNPGSQSNFGNEKARTIELGYRGQWMPTLSSDWVAYVSKYDGVFGFLPGSVMTANPAGTAATGGAVPTDPACTTALATYGLTAGPGLCSTINRGNILPVRTRGLEISTEWRPLDYWRLQLNASRMWVDGMDLSASNLVYGSSPKYQGALRSSFDVNESQHFDLWWRRIGGLDGRGMNGWPVSNTPIAARTELDLRYAVRVSKPLEVALAAQNQLSRQQLQFYPDYMPSLPVTPQHTVYLQAVWKD